MCTAVGCCSVFIRLLLTSFHRFTLAHPVVVVGDLLRVELIGMQRQQVNILRDQLVTFVKYLANTNLCSVKVQVEDSLYYTCIEHVTCHGKILGRL